MLSQYVSMGELSTIVHISLIDDFMSYMAEGLILLSRVLIAEPLGGREYGVVRRNVKISYVMMGVFIVMVMGVLYILDKKIIGLLTVDSQVFSNSLKVLHIYILLIPIVLIVKL
jgi:Na+-driven multidrug efflux pump